MFSSLVTKSQKTSHDQLNKSYLTVYQLVRFTFSTEQALCRFKRNQFLRRFNFSNYKIQRASFQLPFSPTSYISLYLFFHSHQTSSLSFSLLYNHVFFYQKNKQRTLSKNLILLKINHVIYHIVLPVFSTSIVPTNNKYFNRNTSIVICRIKICITVNLPSPCSIYASITIYNIIILPFHNPTTTTALRLMKLAHTKIIHHTCR